MGGKFEGRSLVEFRWVKVGPKLGPCDGFSDGGDLWKIVFGSWTRTMDGLPLGESLGAEY